MNPSEVAVGGGRAEGRRGFPFDDPRRELEGDEKKLIDPHPKALVTRERAKETHARERAARLALTHPASIACLPWRLY